MPSMPGMPSGSVEFHEPPGYGFYQDGAELPWSNLVTPPKNSFMTTLPPPSGAIWTEPLEWFSQGYEPAWDGTLNLTGYLGAGGYAEQDQHDEYGDAYDRVWAPQNSELAGLGHHHEHDCAPPNLKSEVPDPNAGRGSATLPSGQSGIKAIAIHRQDWPEFPPTIH